MTRTKAWKGARLEGIEEALLDDGTLVRAERICLQPLGGPTVSSEDGDSTIVMTGPLRL
jgi:hypothetical protein